MRPLDLTSTLSAGPRVPASSFSGSMRNTLQNYVNDPINYIATYALQAHEVDTLNKLVNKAVLWLKATKTRPATAFHDSMQRIVQTAQHTLFKNTANPPNEEKRPRLTPEQDLTQTEQALYDKIIAETQSNPPLNREPVLHPDEFTLPDGFEITDEGLDELDFPPNKHPHPADEELNPPE